MKMRNCLAAAVIATFALLPGRARAQGACMQAANAAEMAAESRHQMDEISTENAFVAYSGQMGNLMGGGSKMPDNLRDLIHQAMMYAYHNEDSPQANHDAVYAACVKEYGGE